MHLHQILFFAGVACMALGLVSAIVAGREKNYEKFIWIFGPNTFFVAAAVAKYLGM